MEATASTVPAASVEHQTCEGGAIDSVVVVFAGGTLVLAIETSQHVGLVDPDVGDAVETLLPFMSPWLSRFHGSGCWCQRRNQAVVLAGGTRSGCPGSERSSNTAAQSRQR